MNLADQMAREELDALRQRGLLRSLEPLRSRPGAEIELRPGERLINLSSNDYLGLAGDARVAKALAEGALRWGAGAGASRLVTGDLAPLRELRDACARHGAMLLVDEAHATGVFGPRGAGLCAELDVKPDLRMATLSKALGVAGAYVAGSRAVCDLLINRARPLIFSTALPPALACAALESLRISSSAEGDELRARLRTNVERFAAKIPGARADSPIIPLLLGD